MGEKGFGQNKTYLWAARVIIVFGILLGVWLLFKYAAGVFVPFLLAWMLSCAIRPLVDRAVGRSRLPRGLAAGFFVLLFVGVVTALVIWGCSRGLEELGSFMEGLSHGESEISRFLNEIGDWIDSISEHLPFLSRFKDHPEFDAFCAFLDNAFRQGAARALEALSQWVPSALLSVAGSLPSGFIFATSLLLSCYYFSKDDGSLGRALTSRLSPALQAKWVLWRQRLGQAFSRYLRAYLILGLITFFEMFIGLSILKIPYAFLLSWGIALVDFLPLLGAGTVLIPWAGILFMTGDTATALGLLLLFGVSMLIRQVAEPRLVSAGLGVHPLVSLFAVYAGWKLFGLWGMIVAPLAAMILKEASEDAAGDKATTS